MSGCGCCSTPTCQNMAIIDVQYENSPFVTKFEEVIETRCGKIYELDIDVMVESPDGSINIDQVGNKFLLTSSCCDKPDQLVGVNSDDTPGFLVEKLTSCDNSLFTINEKQLPDGRYVLELCPINTPVDKDEKVAMRASCPPMYLEDLINEAFEGCIDIDKTGCSMTFSLKDCCFCKPFAKRFMSTDYEVCYESGGAADIQNSGRFFIPSDLVDQDVCGGIIAETAILTLPSGDTVSVGALRVVKDGRYRLSLDGAADVNYGVNAFRTILMGSVAPFVFIDSKYGEANNAPLNQISNGYAGANSNDLKQYEYGGTKTFFLPAGTLLFAGGRMDNGLTNAPDGTVRPGMGEDGCLIYRHAGLVGGHLAGNNSLEPRAGFSWEVERVRDVDGDMRRQKC